jgi:hypothetical protein
VSTAGRGQDLFGMGLLNFAGALAVGAAALACWLDVRLERARPASSTVRIGHAVAAYAVLRATTAVSHAVVGSGAQASKVVAVLFLVVLPGLVYAFLTGLWLIRTLAEVARLSRH